MNSSKKIITRFAPSPTGLFHIGSVRSALYNYLFTRHHDGEFILRIEDTDKERSKKEYEENILESLEWLGLSYDVIYRQSERTDIYISYLKKLVASGVAYEAEDSADREGKVIRFKNPNEVVSFQDMILGDISVDTTDLGDFVIAKNYNTPLYNFVVVVDDMEMNITHIIRGQDHVSNTPRQILIRRALEDSSIPIFAHIPLVLGSDKSKLSKRHGAVPVLEYREMGYIPEALLNFMALIGWNPGNDREIFNLKELVNEFSLEKVQKGGAIFNTEKLDWVNKEHLRNIKDEEFFQNIKLFIPHEYQDEKIWRKILPLVRERTSKYSDVADMFKVGELQYFFDAPKYDNPDKICWKENSKELTKEYLENVANILETTLDFTQEGVKGSVWPFTEEKGRGDVLWPMRYALSGLEKSPDPFLLAELLGKDETIRRLREASISLE